MTHLSQNSGRASQVDLDHPSDRPLGLRPDDTIVGGGSDGTLNGTNGDDLIIVQGQPGLVNGEGGSDVIHNEGHAPSPYETYISGYDTFWNYDMGTGVDGDDLIHGGDGVQWITGCAGADTLYGEGGDDLLYGALQGNFHGETGDGDDLLDGGDGDDIVRGNYGDDTLVGGAGDDNLGGQWGDDVLDGGAGRDVASYNYSTGRAPVLVSFRGFRPGEDQVLFDYLGGHDRLNGMDALIITGTTFDDTMVGSRADDTLGGNGGDDVLTGGRGNDSFTEYDGDSRLSGGAGDDVAFFYGFAPAGSSFAGGDDTFVGGAGVDGVRLDWRMDTTALKVILHASGSLDAADAAGDIRLDAIGVERLTVHGGVADDQLRGGTSDDVLDGAAGNDRLDGGAGHDTYVVDRSQATDPFGPWTFDASALDGSGAQVVLRSEEYGRDVLTNIEAVSIIGGGGSDTIVGSGGDDFLFDGGLGDGDSLQGGAGDDHVVASLDGAGNYDGGLGSDTLEIVDLYGYVSVDLAAGVASRIGGPQSAIAGFEVVMGPDTGASITGARGAETLIGGDASDAVVGGGGADWIEGGGGADVLTGGAGRDRFVYTKWDQSTPVQSDRITDLQDADQLDLHKIDADTGQAGDQAFHLVGTLDGGAGELALTSSDGQTFLLADIDGDGAADFRVVIDGDLASFSNFLL